MFSGADTGFSQGGGWIFNKILKFLSTFSRSTKLNFCALQITVNTLFCQIFLLRRQTLKKKQAKKGYKHYCKILTKNYFFFDAHSPSNLLYNSNKGAFRKKFNVNRPKMDITK